MHLKVMIGTFFSWEFSWRRVLLISSIAVIALGIVGCLLGYFFLYLPPAEYRSKNQKINEKIQQGSYEMKLRYPTSSPIQP